MGWYRRSGRKPLQFLLSEMKAFFLSQARDAILNCAFELIRCDGSPRVDK